MQVLTEFETKFQLAGGMDAAQLAAYLNITWSGEKHQRDEYYDTRDAALFVRGIFLRVRESSRFQIKFNEDDLASGMSSGHTRCTEIDCPLEFSDADTQELAIVLTKLGLQYKHERRCFDVFAKNNLDEVLVIDKVRQRADVPGGRFYFDAVDGLGTYLEVEMDHAEAAGGIMAAYFDQLRLLVNDGVLIPIDTGYNALYWRNRNFDVYMRCPYVMAKDRKAVGPGLS